jgi:hypothetical protein
VKGKKQLYNNSTWDLVDASQSDPAIVEKLDLTTLPDSLKSKSRAEIKQLVIAKNNERTAIQKEIAAVSIKRESYLAAEKTRQSTKSNEPTLESEIEKIIRQQAKKYNLLIQ